MYVIQHCFICRPSDSSVTEDAGIKIRTVATFALTVKRSNYSILTARSHPRTRLDLIVEILKKPAGNPRTVAVYALTVRVANHLLYSYRYSTDWIAKNVNLLQLLKDDTIPTPLLANIGKVIYLPQRETN
jgi:hypothetical protein